MEGRARHVSSANIPPIQVLVHQSEDQNKNEQKNKTKAFLTQPRTHSKQSIMSENMSIVMSTIAPSYLSTVVSENNNADNKAGNYANGGPNSGDHEEETNSRLEHLEEDRDHVYPLPDGYPRLHDKIFRRKALFFRKPMSSSIKKAAEHLLKLQDRIEAWSREVELDILSRHSGSVAGDSQMSTPRSASAVSSVGHIPSTDARGRRMIRFETPGSILHNSPSVHGSTSHTSHSAHTMSIMGIGASKDAVQSNSLEEEIPHLGAEEVIDEVFVLLGRLESDRADNVTLYDKEQKRVEWLQGRIDKLEKRRMQELPKLVQNEHESCATDIAELKWHCAYRKRQFNRVDNQTQVAEVLNKRLLEDIAFVQKHCPLVEEKLDLESEAMKRIDQAQNQTTDELNKTIDKLHRTENKSHEAHGKSDMERTHIKQELDNVREALKQISLELEQAKAMHASHVHTCHDVREKIKANAQTKILLETQNDNARSAEKLKSSVVKELQDKIIHEEFQHRKLADHNYQLTDQMERMRKEFEKFQTELKGKVKVTLEDLRKRQERCREMKMEIEDTNVKLKDCSRQRLADSKNMDRIAREMKKVETQLSVVEEEFEKITIINGAIKNKLIGEEEKTLTVEENLKGISETLRKQVKEETHSRTVLQARIASDTTDLAKQQVEAKKKKVKVSKKAKELEEITNGTLSDTQVLREQHANKTRTIQNAETQLADLKSQHEKTEESLTKMKEVLEPRCKKLEVNTIVSAPVKRQTGQPLSLQEENVVLCKRLDFMSYRSDVINQKLRDMTQSSGFMHKVIKTTEESITELNVEMEEMEIQLEVGKKQQAVLKAHLEEVDDREKQGDDRHLEHMKAREEVLKEKEEQLQENLQINKKLAHDYRLIQNELYKVKHELLDTFEHRVGLESSLKDHKQLNGLQLRLHDALSRYYSIRGLYNTNELARFDEIAVENSERINTLQHEMDIAIDTISQFLTDQLDGTAARMVAAAARSVLTGTPKDSFGKDTRQQLPMSREPLTRESLVRESTMVGPATRQRSRLTVNSFI